MVVPTHLEAISLRAGEVGRTFLIGRATLIHIDLSEALR